MWSIHECVRPSSLLYTNLTDSRKDKSQTTESLSETKPHNKLAKEPPRSKSTLKSPAIILQSHCCYMCTDGRKVQLEAMSVYLEGTKKSQQRACIDSRVLFTASLCHSPRATSVVKRILNSLAHQLAVPRTLHFITLGVHAQRGLVLSLSVCLFLPPRATNR